ncbi:unnamed protein product, partial [Didymodactylos carnosus]
MPIRIQNNSTSDNVSATLIDQKLESNYPSVLFDDFFSSAVKTMTTIDECSTALSSLSTTTVDKTNNNNYILTDSELAAMFISITTPDADNQKTTHDTSDNTLDDVFLQTVTDLACCSSSTTSIHDEQTQQQSLLNNFSSSLFKQALPLSDASVLGPPPGFPPLQTLNERSCSINTGQINSISSSTSSLSSLSIPTTSTSSTAEANHTSDTLRSQLLMPASNNSIEYLSSSSSSHSLNEQSTFFSNLNYSLPAASQMNTIATTSTTTTTTTCLSNFSLLYDNENNLLYPFNNNDNNVIDNRTPQPSNTTSEKTDYRLTDDSKIVTDEVVIQLPL